jgi:pyruvate,orthophosphate dikinase
MEPTKYVCSFEEADGSNRTLFGGKGAGLAEMTQIGLPVPPGFVITTAACRQYYSDGKKLTKELVVQVNDHIRRLEKKTGRAFGQPTRPLLVSVRSGAAISMPGMMDTILNLGLNDQVVEGLVKITQNRRFAFDTYRRLIQLFGKVAMGLDDAYFDVILRETKKRVGAELDTDLDAKALQTVCEDYKRCIKRELGRVFPQDPWEQLKIAVEAVFRSWMGKRAVDYRKEFRITPDMANGTAVNVCTMVFGNMGSSSATGVAFTRDPGTGENVLFGEYLTNAQGEDVVAGTRTPKPIAELKQEMPKQHQQLEQVRHTLEDHYHEVQDFEFTIELGKLYVLQTRNGKMNASALVKTSRDMVREKLLSKQEALLRITPEHLEQLLHRRIDPKAKAEPLAQGIAASPGAAMGRVVFDADQAERRGTLGEPVILVREETKPEDIHGFFRSKGILTSRGGKTSHAAVVARGMGKPCVVGCEDIEIDERNRVAIVNGHHIPEGDMITIDGATGSVYLGEVPTIDPEFGPDLKTILRWADEIRTLGVRANADTPKDATVSKRLGAEGIGLCRTERMFNASDRLPIVREMILANTAEERQAALDKLFPMQKGDFAKIFKKMDGLPVTIRLLDPPLHEFLPTVESLLWEIERLKEVKKSLQQMETIPDSFRVILEPSLRQHVAPIEHIMMEVSDIREKSLFDELLDKKQEILRKVRETAEVNPMLGHRGVRLGVKYPEIYRMQIQAVLEAAAELVKEGAHVQPEIMVPQVCTAQELKQVRKWMDSIHKSVEQKHHVTIRFKFGTMIEVVRACMRAGRLAEVTDFFSFGTNDLTQATFSFSREDAEKKFLPLYNEMQILMDNPFDILDIKGVGRLMKLTMEWGKKTNPELKVGICGEHGGNPRSIEFCHTLGLDYVSCSSFRVPIARLVAAQARLRELQRAKAEREDPDYPFNVFF